MDLTLFKEFLSCVSTRAFLTQEPTSQLMPQANPWYMNKAIGNGPQETEARDLP